MVYGFNFSMIEASVCLSIYYQMSAAIVMLKKKYENVMLSTLQKLRNQ